MTFKHDLMRAKVNRHAKYLGQRSFCSKVIVCTRTNTTDRLTAVQAINCRSVGNNLLQLRARARQMYYVSANISLFVLDSEVCGGQTDRQTDRSSSTPTMRATVINN